MTLCSSVSLINSTVPWEWVTLLCFFIIGGDSASKEHKKKTVENNETEKIEILAFSPERRWADKSKDRKLISTIVISEYSEYLQFSDAYSL